MTTRHRRRAAVLATLVCLAAAPASADFPQGVWRGVLTSATGESTPVQLEFSDMAGRPLAMMAMPGAGDVGLSSIAFDGRALSFSYRDGATWLRCALARQADGAYAGPCLAGGDTVSSIRVEPTE